ncbi:MAG TPA: hypothetical protein VGR21_01010 [Cryptosporangiaceae bacterium]|nr:hypothetical protein [Cryptosporangiaceae bacterium]
MTSPEARQTTTGDLVAGTGDVRVDTALERLDALAAVPVTEHVAGYEDVYRTLQETLASVDAT